MGQSLSNPSPARSSPATRPPPPLTARARERPYLGPVWRSLCCSPAPLPVAVRLRRHAAMACVPRARRRQAALGPAPLRSCACAEPPRALPLAPHVPQGRPPPWPPEPSAAVGFPAAQIAVSAARLSKPRLPRALRRRPVAPPLHAVPVPFPEKRRHEECRSPCAAKFRPTPCKSDAGDFSEEIKISGVGS